MNAKDRVIFELRKTNFLQFPKHFFPSLFSFMHHTPNLPGALGLKTKNSSQPCLSRVDMMKNEKNVRSYHMTRQLKSVFSRQNLFTKAVNIYERVKEFTSHQNYCYNLNSFQSRIRLKFLKKLHLAGRPFENIWKYSTRSNWLLSSLIIFIILFIVR